MCQLNFNQVNTEELINNFNQLEANAVFWLKQFMPLVAYEKIIEATHIFNLIDAQQSISITERQNYILRIRTLAVNTAKIYLNNQKISDIQ
jgi:glycyl-tRNA synthetase alpha chain